jgi:hypothetical protein
MYRAATIHLQRAPHPSVEAHHGLWLHWVMAMTLGELAGFAAPAAVGALAFGLELPALAALPLFVLAGTVEGAALGFAQSVVLCRELPGLSRWAWVIATASAAAVAWLLGMLPNTVGELTGDNAAVSIALWVAAAPVLLNTLGVAQWRVLRGHVEGAGWWVPASAAAWLAGVSVVFVAMALISEDTPVWLVALIGSLSGCLMGAVAAAVSGVALVRLLAANRNG